MNWEVKYKTLKAAFREMSRINSRYKKEQVKEMQRKDQRIRDLVKAATGLLDEIGNPSGYGPQEISWMMRVDEALAKFQKGDGG